MIDSGLLEVAKDKFGRDGFKYSRNRKRRAVRRTRAAVQTDDIDLQAEQAKKIKEAISGLSIGSMSRRKQPKAIVELSKEEEEDVQNAIKASKKNKSAIAQIMSKCEVAIASCEESKHPLRQKVKHWSLTRRP